MAGVWWLFQKLRFLFFAFSISYTYPRWPFCRGKCNPQSF